MRYATLSALIVCLAAPAFAAPAPELMVEAPRYATILIGDLDFNSSAGERLFKRRLNLALEEVCGSHAGNVVKTEEDTIIACREAAGSSARAQLADRAARLAAGRPVGKEVRLSAR